MNPAMATYSVGLQRDASRSIFLAGEWQSRVSRSKMQWDGDLSIYRRESESGRIQPGVFGLVPSGLEGRGRKAKGFFVVAREVRQMLVADLQGGCFHTATLAEKIKSLAHPPAS